MKFFPIVFCMLFPIFTWAQGGAVNLGYNYFGKNNGFVGYDYRLTDIHKPAFNIGVGTYLTSIQKKFTLIPEIHTNYSWDKVLLTEMSVSTKNIKPSVGVNLLNAAHINLGYSFAYKSSDHLNGFFVGLHLFWQTSKFYDDFNYAFR